MSSFIRRSILTITGILVVSLAVASTAAPAAAAGPILVDDDGAQCATPYHTIHDALAAAAALPDWSTPTPKTITVCAGTYAEPAMFINGANNLRLIAKKGVTVTPNAPLFDGSLFQVNASSKVRIQGFTIDGLSDLGPSSMFVLHISAINYTSSTGTIANNTIVHWRRASVSNVNIEAIAANNSTGELVHIDHNVIADFMAIGIFSDSPKQSITRNALDSSSLLPSLTWAIYVAGATQGRVTDNKITSDAYPTTGTASRGITVVASNHLQVAGNAIGHYDTGIWLATTCDVGSTTSHNRVFDNMILDAFTGVKLLSDGTSCGGPTHADNNRITGNRILVDSTTLGNFGVDVSAGPAGSTALSTIVKNNTVKHYTPGQEIYVDPTTGGDYTGGVFAPNHIVP